MTLSRPVNDFAFIEQETIILERAMCCFARKEVNFPCFRVHPCSSVVGISPCPLGSNLNYLNQITVFLVGIV
jgi:hypothetical protein